MTPRTRPFTITIWCAWHLGTPLINGNPLGKKLVSYRPRRTTIVEAPRRGGRYQQPFVVRLSTGAAETRPPKRHAIVTQRGPPTTISQHRRANRVCNTRGRPFYCRRRHLAHSRSCIPTHALAQPGSRVRSPRPPRYDTCRSWTPVTRFGASAIQSPVGHNMYAVNILGKGKPVGGPAFRF